MPASAAPAAFRPLKLLSFNIQAGAKTTEAREYLTRGWQSVLPHRGKQSNLDTLAALARDYDCVGLQEADSHSVRSGFRHQVECLAESAGFPFWSHQRNRALTVAAPGNGVLSKIEPSVALAHRLPGRIPGRGALELRFGEGDTALRLFVVHLALTPRARGPQIAYLAEAIADAPHVILMGDLNCEPDASELGSLFRQTALRPAPHLPSYPAWDPERCIDQILCSKTLRLRRYEVLGLHISDHLPVTAEVDVPEAALGER